MKRKNKKTPTTTSKKPRSGRRAKNKRAEPKTAEQLFAKPKRSEDTWKGVVNTVWDMRANGTSRQKASLKFGVDPRTVSRLAGAALRKLKNGRYVAKAWDRLLRVVMVLTKRKGLLEVATRDSRQASLAGRHWAAVQRYLETGDATRLAEFRNKYIIDASGKRVALLTDLPELDRLASAGVLSFESLYARSR